MRRILFLSFDEDLRTIVRELLEGSFFVTSAKTHRQGLHELKQKSFDLILLDFSFKDYEATQFLNHLQYGDSQVPLVLFTSYSYHGLKEQINYPFFTSVIEKPTTNIKNSLLHIMSKID